MIFKNFREKNKEYIFPPDQQLRVTHWDGAAEKIYRRTDKKADNGRRLKTATFFIPFFSQTSNQEVMTDTKNTNKHIKR